MTQVLDVDEAAALHPFFAVLANVSDAATLPLFRTGTAVENKHEAGFDPVTEADRNCETALRRSIAEHYPQAGIVGEEFGAEREDARDVWVLDPIDGTRAFIAGIPLWGVLAGLRREGRAVAGMMHQPFTGETFVGLHAATGSEATYTRGGKSLALKTRPCGSLDDAYAMTTAPELLNERTARVLDGVRHLRFGADCYAFCMLAMGQVDIVVEADVEAYDVLALIPIIEAAGGVMTTFDGGRPETGGTVIASGDPALHALALQRLAS